MDLAMFLATFIIGLYFILWFYCIESLINPFEKHSVVVNIIMCIILVLPFALGAIYGGL